MKRKLKKLLKNKKVQKKIKDVLISISSLIALILTLSSCGTTRATITKPAEGTSTTITITTNNPITTNTSPTVNLK